MKNNPKMYALVITGYGFCCGLNFLSIYLNLDSIRLNAKSLAIFASPSRAQVVKYDLDSISSHEHLILMLLATTYLMAALSAYWAYMIGKAKGKSSIS